MDIVLDKLSNHDVAYHMGIMDTLTIMFEKYTSDDNNSKDFIQECPKSLLGALEARRRYLIQSEYKQKQLIDRDIIKAATLAQRAVDDISNHSGSMSDIIVYTHSGFWTWAPAYSVLITQRPTTVPACRLFDSMSKAQRCADEFSESVRKISKWADSSVRRLIQLWAQRRQRMWCNTMINNVICADLVFEDFTMSDTLNTPNNVVVCIKIQINDAETAINTFLHIVRNIDDRLGKLIYFGTVECPDNCIIFYAIISQINTQAATSLCQKMLLNNGHF